MLLPILVILDIVLLNVTFVASFLIRFGGSLPEFNFSAYQDNYLFLTLAYILTLAYAQAYKKRFKSFWDLFKCLFLGLFYGTILGIVLVYIFRLRWASFPTAVFIIALPLGQILLFGYRACLLDVAGRIRRKVIIVGHVQPGDLLDDSRRNVHIIQVDTIEEILPYQDIDEIVITERIHEDKQMNLLISLLLRLKVNVVFSPAIYARLISGNVMEENTMRYLATFLGRKSDYEEFLIRIFDIAGSIFLLLCFGPLFVVIPILIKLTSRGPVFFIQQRITKDGKIFSLYKFRTMIRNAEKYTGPVLASENDPRITRLGRILRRNRLDEIPQLFNVIRGDMSLVGPRPERPHFVKQHQVLREVRLAVKPGLTGLAQIRSAYDLHPRHKIKYDYLYIQKRSLRLNIYILWKTIPVIFRGKGR